MGARSSAGAIAVSCQVGMCLRMLANAQYLDAMMCFCVSMPTVYKCTHAVFSVVLNKLPLRSLPRTDQERIAVAAVFAIVDGTYRFMYVAINCVGSTHDSIVFSATKLVYELEDKLIPVPYHLVGDDAYTCSNYMLVPVPAMRAPRGSVADAYNFFQCPLRIHVEKAFGQLLTRWRLLGSHPSFSLRSTVRIIETAMALHNFCKDVNDVHLRDDATAAELAEVHHLVNVWMAQMHHETQRGRRRDLEQSLVRDAVIADILT
eukprot:IDg12339t1